MPQLPIVAYGYAARFKIREIAGCFAGARVQLAKTQLVAVYGEDRFAFAFDFGAVVFVNVVAEERTRVLGELRRRIPTEPHAPLEEEFLLEISADAPPHGRVAFDRVVLPQVALPEVEVTALLLAQSVALDYYDEDMEEILKALGQQTEHMARTGRILGRRADLPRFVARILSTKNQIITGVALLDKPAETWERESLDRLHRELREMLEIDDRYRALEHKLRSTQETLEIFLDMQQTRTGHALEAIIVLLILVEIGFTLLDKLS